VLKIGLENRKLVTLLEISREFLTVPYARRRLINVKS